LPTIAAFSTKLAEKKEEPEIKKLMSTVIENE